MSIYIVMHKIIDVHKKKGFVPLLVGAKNFLGEVPVEIKRDDSIKDNISNKNKNYCELTGMYWMWKNKEINENEIIGLCHYRRFFIKNALSVKKETYLDYENIERILRKYDIIVPKQRTYANKIKDNFSNAPKKEDMEKTKRIIQKLYPEYIDSFNKFLDGHTVYFYNMFIAKKSVMNEYFKWLFDILFELEKEIDISNYDDYEARIYGFIAERLFNVWIIKNKDKISIKENYVYNETDTYFGFLKHEMANIYRRIIYGK